MGNDEQLIQETNHILDQACKDFNIDPQGLVLKVTLHEGKSIYGSAQIITKKVNLERGRNASSAAAQFTIYHEVAHIADHTLACYLKVIKPMLIIGTAALLYSIGALHYQGVNNSGVSGSNILSTKTVGATALALGAGGLVVGFAHLVNKHMIYRSENRANYHACEQLLKRNNYQPIMEYYCMLSASRINGKRRIDPTHPTIESEMSNLQHCLARKGYRITIADDLTHNSYQLQLYQGDAMIRKMMFRVLGCE